MTAQQKADACWLLDSARACVLKGDLATSLRLIGDVAQMLGNLLCDELRSKPETKRGA